MIKEEIIQKFLHDLGPLTCSEEEAIAYFRNSGEDPTECLTDLRAIPSIHFVNEKIWQD